MPAQECLIFPLDFHNWPAAEGFVRTLAGQVGGFKVGLDLFSAQGPKVLDRIRDLAPEAKLMMDLKMYDIPGTVAGAVEALHIHDYRPDFITVHAAGGPEMLRAASQASDGIKVLAVPLMPSLEASRFEIHVPAFRFPINLTRHYADMAFKAGCSGFLCTGPEIRHLKLVFPKAVIAAIGIRPVWSLVPHDDQKQITTPRQAINDGADYLIVGRPISLARDPKEAAAKCVEEIAAVLPKAGNML